MHTHRKAISMMAVSWPAFWRGLRSGGGAIAGGGCAAVEAVASAEPCSEYLSIGDGAKIMVVSPAPCTPAKAKQSSA